MGKNIWGENVLDSKDPNDPYSVISRGGLVDNVISEQGGGEKEDGEIKLAGHLFEEDGVYIGQWGKKTNNCFSVKKGAWRIEEEKGKRTIYYEKQNLTKLTDLNFSAIELDTVLKLSSIFFDEGGGSTEFYEDTIVAIACANSNYLKARNNYFSVVTYKNLAYKEEIPNYAYGKNTWIKKIDNTNIKNVTSIKAVLHILLNKGDTSNGAVRWDGADLAWKGNNHDKPKNEGIDFKEIHFNSFKSFYTKERIKKYTGNNSGFSTELVAGKHLATNRNKGRVLNISTAFVGNSVFWKPNYFAEENEVQFETKNGKQVKVKEKYDFKYYFK